MTSKPSVSGTQLITVADLIQPHEDIDWEEASVEKKGLRRLRGYSLLRILLGLLIVAGVGGFGTYEVRQALVNAVPVRSTYFAPYVDVTLPPTYQFQDPSNNVAKQTVLGFIVAQNSHTCTPTWGSYYSLASAEQSLNLTRRVIEYQNLGGTPFISFGGQTHTHLSVACKSPASLATAYKNVITTYATNHLDFDTEGSALNNYAALERRAQALHLLENSYHHRLDIWLTLPVSTSGLDDNALAAIKVLLIHRVYFSGINLMTMDYGKPLPNMTQAIETSLKDAHNQILYTLSSFGDKLNSRQIWNRMGMTYLIGQNNSIGEEVTLADAAALNRFALSAGLRRVSFWSLNRDTTCGPSFTHQQIYSNNCSDAQSAPLQFSHLEFTSLKGSVGTPDKLIRITQQPTTNPANAPFPIWQPTYPYPQNYKVVWNGYVYQAKWFNQGEQPSQQFQYPWQTPWQLIGPVLPTDHAPVIKHLPPGTYPSWSSSTTYQAGTIVEFQGLPYQAKWLNTDESPEAAASDPTYSPWLPLYTIPGEPTPVGYIPTGTTQNQQPPG
jgi:chitinase